MAPSINAPFYKLCSEITEYAHNFDATLTRIGLLVAVTIGHHIDPVHLSISLAQDHKSQQIFNRVC